MCFVKFVYKIKSPTRVGDFSCAQGGTRTRTRIRAGDFKSPMSTIPSPGQAGMGIVYQK